MRCTVSGEIRRSRCRLLRTVETEPIDTPARAATLITVGRTEDLRADLAMAGKLGITGAGDRK